MSLARLRKLAPGLRTVGLSATVARPSELRAYLVPQHAPQSHIDMADLVHIVGGAKPQIDILELDETMPTVGHTTRYAIGEIYAAIEAHRLCLLFVNTRMQAELLFQDLWRVNDLGLPIALHHGSLDAMQRRKVEAAMAEGSLRAVVATSTLDLGIDWGDVDLVIHVGAPKGASRFIQRIGRSNHRLDEPSQAVLVPSNRFEVLECRAAVDAAEAGEQDVTFSRQGALDVLAQHILGTACAGDFDPTELYAEVDLGRALRGRCRARRSTACSASSPTAATRSNPTSATPSSRPAPDGKLRIAHPRFIQAYRMNAGTIVAAPLIKVRLVGRRAAATRKAMTGGRMMGEVDEYFIEQLRPGDAFVLAGEVLRFEGMSENEAFVTRASARDPVIPSYNSGKFPLSTHLAERVRAMLADDHAWSRLPPSVAYWLEQQQQRSVIPGRDEVLIETFARGNCHYLVAYPFEGRLAHQTLGMLLTRRLDRIGAGPLGFVANDYGMALWTIGDLSALVASGKLDLDDLFARGHAGRRPRRLAGGIEPDEAHLPAGRRHRRPRRAPPSGAREDRPPGGAVDQPHLRRAAPPRPASHSAGGGVGRCGHRPSRHRAPRGFSASHRRQNQASTVGQGIAAFCADPAGNRQGGGRRFCPRGAAARGRRAIQVATIRLRRSNARAET